MSWKNSIPGCFGCEDKKFAMHPNDIQRAADIIKEVNAAGDGWSDYLAPSVSLVVQLAISPESTSEWAA